MNRYFFFSATGHVLLVASWFFLGTLLSRPRMSYYSVDLYSSLPAGSAAGVNAPAPAAAPTKPQEAPPAPPVPVVQKVPQEAIRLLGKKKKERPVARPQPKRISAAKLLALTQRGWQQSGASPGRTSGVSGGGAGIVAQAGPAFPYPWYLKQVTDRLHQQWHPPQDFPDTMVCQVAFVIHRSGEVSDVQVEKSSGDGTYDDLAMRAVLYSNPMPPLPAGFPDETLKVHLKLTQVVQ